jgi:cation diffusion facilitator family transporter
MNKSNKVMVIAFFTNLILSIMQVLVGIIGRSSAILADGVHTISDLITDIIAIIGNLLSNKPADDKHPNGHGKIEYLTSIIIGIAIILIAFLLARDTLTKEAYIPSVILIWIAAITIISKYILSKYVIKKGVEYNNAILIASGHENFADVISSLVVLLSIILMQLAVYNEIFLYADKLAALIVSLFILKTGLDIIIINISNIIGEKEQDPILTKEITNIILKQKEVLSIDRFVLIKYGPYYKLDLELVMDGNKSLKEVHKIIDIVEKELKKKHKVRYITTHVNPKK